MSASPRTRRPVIVKLGGSVITRKRETEHLRPKNPAAPLGRTGGLLGGPARDPPRGGIVRAPRGPQVRARAPAGPGDLSSHRARGASIVAAEVRRLHLAVIRELVRAGLSVGSVPPSTHAMNREGRLDSLDPTPFRTVLDAGLEPVSFGDVVPDRVWGWSILSADTIAVSLAAALHAERVLFVSDVPGILVSGKPGRQQVEAEVTPAVVETLRPHGTGADVTGGIRGKAEAMLAIARSGADAGLISGLKDGELSRAVRGESVYGSWARGRPRDDAGRDGNRP